MVDEDDRRRSTPPSGTAIPRPRAKPSVPEDASTYVPRDTATYVPADTVDAKLGEVRLPPPPRTPSLEDIYRLIDERLSPEIIERVSSVPPPESRPSISVRAAKTTGRWTKWAMAAIGVLACVGQLFAEVERYRGPISQAVIILARVLDSEDAPLEPEAELPLGEP